MKEIPTASVDMILCDLPYGTTQCKWDIFIPFDLLWEQYVRIAMPNAAIVLFGNEPFSSQLRLSNRNMYRYDWIWEKTKAQGFLNAKKMPLKAHEVISVFSKNPTRYYPQGLVKGIYNNYRDSKLNKVDDVYGNERKFPSSQYGNYPKSVLKFSNKSGAKQLHPTQKPVDLCEYLIRTYTKEGDIVLDNCMGSGSTGVAALNTNRRFIGIELDPTYCGIAKERIQHVVSGIS